MNPQRMTRLGINFFINKIQQGLAQKKNNALNFR